MEGRNEEKLSKEEILREKIMGKRNKKDKVIRSRDVDKFNARRETKVEREVSDMR